MITALYLICLEQVLLRCEVLQGQIRLSTNWTFSTYSIVCYSINNFTTGLHLSTMARHNTCVADYLSELKNQSLYITNGQVLEPVSQAVQSSTKDIHGYSNRSLRLQIVIEISCHCNITSVRWCEAGHTIDQGFSTFFICTPLAYPQNFLHTPRLTFGNSG